MFPFLELGIFTAVYVIFNILLDYVLPPVDTTPKESKIFKGYLISLIHSFASIVLSILLNNLVTYKICTSGIALCHPNTLFMEMAFTVIQ